MSQPPSRGRGRGVDRGGGSGGGGGQGRGQSRGGGQRGGQTGQGQAPPRGGGQGQAPRGGGHGQGPPRGGGGQGGQGQRGGYQGGGGDRGQGHHQGGGGNFQRGQGYHQSDRGHQGDRGGGYRGGQGSFPRGGGGGRGRGGGGRFAYKPDPLREFHLPEEKAKDAVNGWQTFDYERWEDVQLQNYKGKDAIVAEKNVKVSVNHFKLRNFRFPKQIYHYEVEMERIKSKPKSEPKAGPSTKATRGRGGKKGGGGPPPAEGAGGLPPKKLPRPLPQLILTVLLEKIAQELGSFCVVSDLSNNLYSTKRLEGKVQMEWQISMTEVDQEILQEDDNSMIKVTIIPTDLEIDTDLERMAEYLDDNKTFKGLEMWNTKKATIEQVYNAVVKSLPTFKFIAMGRANLMRWPSDNTQDRIDLKGNVFCYKGLSANIGMGWQPYLCADIAHTAFVADTPVLEALKVAFTREFWDRSQPSNPDDYYGWSDKDYQAALDLLKGKKVWYKPSGSKIGGPVTGISDQNNAESTFEKDGQTISVRDYFRTTYNKNVNPKGPCLILRTKNQVPAELCTIKKGQGFSKKLNDIQTTEMLTIAKKDPRVLYNEITDEVKKLDSKSPLLQSWGFQMPDKMLELDTRVLPSPILRYGEGPKGHVEITPENGQWDVWNEKFNFFKTKNVLSWGVLVVGRCQVEKPDIYKFADALKQNARSKNIIFPEENPHIELKEQLRDNEVEKNVKELTATFNKTFSKCDLVLVIIPKKGSSLYPHVKQAAEIKAGILTQCVVGKNVGNQRFPFKPATVQNIILKINSKLGGINYCQIPPTATPQMPLPPLNNIELLKCPMLIIGADVTHPPPGTAKVIKGKSYEVPSFAAVTGSIDKTGMPFMMEIKAQKKAGKGAAEVIEEFDKIVIKLLQRFYEETAKTSRTGGIRPRRIIYFRDGVGEGQFPQVLHVEMMAIRKACNKFKDYDGGNYEPKITFITVQKRHKTRFFYHNGHNIENPLAGTVVDKEIVHQTENDFYLCSHKGMMGTSRPTRYHVLWDDSFFSKDEIQLMTYYLCFMYTRCTKSVRIPAPTYYSHWACLRAKAFSEGLEIYYNDLQELNRQMRRSEEFVQRFPMHFV